MRFQITIKPKAHATSHDEVAIFIVNAPNWETAALMCNNRIERMILKREDVYTEIAYASDEKDTVRHTQLCKTEPYGIG